MGVRRRARRRGPGAALLSSRRSTASASRSDDAPPLGAAGALLRYLAELQPGGLPHLARPAVRRSEAHLWLDEMTRRNLELVEPLRGRHRSATLLETIDRTVTPMGGRLLRQWVLSPLRDVAAIEARLDAVETCLRDGPRPHSACARRSMACATSSGSPAARPPDAPRRASSARSGIRSCGCPMCVEALDELPWARSGSAALWPTARDGARPARRSRRRLLARALVDRPPATLAEGGVIRAGYDAELDELRELRDGGRQSIASMQQRERERTGIASLKVGFNRVFGYYLEVTNAHRDRVPADYERRQTLAGAERYVTPELKEYEAKVLGAEERIGRRARRSCSRQLRQPGGRRHRAGAAHGARAGAARRVGRRWPRWPEANQYVRPDARRRLRPRARGPHGIR